MMRTRFARGDDLIAYFGRKGNIRQCIAVNVTDLALADAKLRPAKAMRMRFDPVPA